MSALPHAVPPAAPEVRTLCPACGAAGSAERYVKDGYRVLRCPRCASMFVSNLPTPEAISAIYQNDAYYQHPAGTLERIRRENRLQVEWLRRHAPAGRLLDVGCASGLFLDGAAQAGWATHGVEQTPSSVAAARAKGHHVFSGTLEDFGASDEFAPFDVVVCLEVVEHVPDPAAFVAQLAACVRPGGILMLSTPNYSGVVARAFGSRDPFFIPPEHLNFLTRRGVLAMAAKAGLTPVRSRTFGSLLPHELDRSVVKYLGPRMAPVQGLLKPVIPVAMRAVNALGLGMEMEYCFTRAAS